MTVPVPTFAMADSITPSDLLGLPSRIVAYAGYDNGNWADYQAIAAEHPGAYLLDFTVFLAAGTGGDFEPGDMDPSQAVAYYNDAKAAGVVRPVFYSSIDTEMAAIWGNLAGAGVQRSGVRLLSAHYGAGMHICGPTTCNLGEGIQCDGTQWTDHADDGSGLGNWDESILAADFFSAQPAPPAPPPPTEEPMPGVSPTVRTPDGFYHRATILYPGHLMHSWLDGTGVGWRDENVAAKADPSGGPVGQLTFADQVPTCELRLDASGHAAQLVIGAQQAVAGYSFEFDQNIGSSGWGAAQLTSGSSEKLTRILAPAA